MSYGHISQRRRTFGPTADFVLSQAHLLPYRRRYVLRRLRPLCGHQRARRGGSIEIRNTRTGAAIHLTDVPRLDHRFLCHRVHRRPLWAAFHVSVQPDDLRACLARGSVRARHDDAQHSAFRYGSGPRCRNRGRLFHHDRVRAAADARSLARLYVVYRGVRAAGNRATWQLDHPELRLAADVRDLRPRLARCLVSPQIATGVAARLETQGRTAEAEALMQGIEKEAATAAPLPPPQPATPIPPFSLSSLLTPSLLPSMVVGSVALIMINTLIFGFVQWLPTFFVQQGLSITKSFDYTLVIITGSPIGCAIGAFSCDYFGRKPSLIAAALATIALGAIYPFMHEASALLTVGFLLIVAIYVQVAILFGVYTPELFPTEVRLRANGICNTIGRAATIVSPFIVLALFRNYGVTGVLGLMIGLLIVHIIVLAVWGIEPVNRGLEGLETVTAKAAPAPP